MGWQVILSANEGCRTGGLINIIRSMRGINQLLYSILGQLKFGRSGNFRSGSFFAFSGIARAEALDPGSRAGIFKFRVL
jgi:hypothetical protein